MKNVLAILLTVTALAKSELIIDSKHFDYASIIYDEQICSVIKANVSKNCAEQVNEICSNRSLLGTFIDASAKLPYTGMKVASRLDFGNYDQCVAVNHQYAGGKILGKYCLAGLVIPDFTNISSSDLAYKLSICMPDLCSAEDYTSIFKSILKLDQLPLLFRDSACVTVESGREISASDVVTMCIFAVCILLMIFSTIYDLYLRKANKKSPHPLYLAFSILTNGEKLLKTSKGSADQIQVFHGMKTISMMWIMAGHGFVSWDNYSIINKEDFANYRSKLHAAYMSASQLAVDTFFFMSGFLLAYQYLKMKNKPLKLQIFSVPQMYIHRYLRLTPAVLMLYLVSISVFSHLGSGPIWASGFDKISKPCRENWWPFFLYIQNYYNYDDICLVHTWYLSADMQMFIVTPVILIPLAVKLRDPKGLKICMYTLLVVNIVLVAVTLVTRLEFREYTNANIYDTHSRMINYVIGIMMGAFIRERRSKPFLYNKFKNLSIANLIIWIVVLLGMLATALFLQETEMNGTYETQTIFYSLKRPAWCTGLCWILYSSLYGYGGFVKWFLSRPIFQIGGKLSYCMYLVHGLVVAHWVMVTRTRNVYSEYVEYYYWCGFFITTIVWSFFWTLAFESPLITIERVIFGGGTTRRAKTKTPRNSNKLENGVKIISVTTKEMQ